MQLLTPEGSKLLSKELMELLNGLAVAIIIAGLVAIWSGIRSLRKLLHNVKDLVTTVQPDFTEHKQQDADNFQKVFAIAEKHSLEIGHLSNQVGGLSNQMEHLTTSLQKQPANSGD